MIQTLTDGSSLISQVTWENNLDNALGTLTVTFRKGYSYQYYNVPENVYHTLVEAESVGTTFSKLVARKYEYVKVTE